MQSSFERKACASVGLGAFRTEENAELSPDVVDSATLHFFVDKPNVRDYLFPVTTNPLSEAARLMGSRTSPRKAKTSRENGKLGGRPKKTKKRGKRAA